MRLVKRAHHYSSTDYDLGLGLQGSVQAMANSEQHFARLGSNVLIDLNNGDRLTFARLHPSATIKIGNTRCSLSPLIDSPYGSTFELQRGPKGPFLVKVPRAKIDQNQATVEPCDAVDDDVNMGSDVVNMLPGRDNRSLVDDNTAQKLSAHDIHRLRMDCASGKDIVNALIANSTTFQNKTAYSQEKYKRKKQKKYAPSFVLRRPSSRRICEAYFIKSPQKIGFLRMDTMGLMMSLANVSAYAEVLVMDMVGGLLTAAATERTGGCGSVCSVYCTEKPTPLDIVGLLNLSSSTASRLFRVSIWELSAALKKDACNDAVGHAATAAAASAEASCKGAHSSSNIMLGNEGLGAENHMGSAPDDNSMHEGEGKGDEKEVKLTVHGDRDMHVEKKGVVHVEKEPNASGSMENGSYAVLNDECLVAADEGSAEVDVHRQCGDMKPSGMKANEIIRPGRNPSPADTSRWAKHGFTSLLIGAPEMEPWSIAQELLPLLCPSSPFVIYHRYLQPLAQCMHELQLNKMAVALEIVEPWLREYQILPSRTHPHMQMNATGGYVLSGIKISPS